MPMSWMRPDSRPEPVNALGERLPAAPRPPLPRALLCLVGSTALTIGLMLFIPQAASRPMDWAWLHGGMAAAMGWAAALPWWWLPMLLLFAPAALFASQFDVPSLVWLLAALLPLLVLRGAVRDRVPLFLTDEPAVLALLHWVPDDRPLSLLDLGCGTGRVLAAVRRERPIVRLAGVENAPLTWLFALWRLRHDAVQVHFRSIWDQPLDAYDVVFAYLSPAAMPRLWQKALAEMPPGSVLVSNSFGIPGVEPDETVELPGRVATCLYLWRIPDRA